SRLELADADRHGNDAHEADADADVPLGLFWWIALDVQCDVSCRGREGAGATTVSGLVRKGPCRARSSANARCNSNLDRGLGHRTPLVVRARGIDRPTSEQSSICTTEELCNRFQVL